MFVSLCMWISLVGGQSAGIHSKTPIQLLEIKKKVSSKWKTLVIIETHHFGKRNITTPRHTFLV